MVSKEIIITGSFVVTSLFPIYKLLSMNKYKEILMFVPSLITSILVQTKRNNTLIKRLDIITSLLTCYIGYTNLLSYPILKLNYFALPTLTFLVYFMSITSNKMDNYYYYHELWHHLLNISLYLTL